LQEQCYILPLDASGIHYQGRALAYRRRATMHFHKCHSVCM